MLQSHSTLPTYSILMRKRTKKFSLDMGCFCFALKSQQHLLGLLHSPSHIVTDAKAKFVRDYIPIKDHIQKGYFDLVLKL